MYRRMRERERRRKDRRERGGRRVWGSSRSVLDDEESEEEDVPTSSLGKFRKEGSRVMRKGIERFQFQAVR